MGQELECRLRYQRRNLQGKARLETDHLLFRGEERLKILFKELTGVRAQAGVLRLEFPCGPAEFELGTAAEKWAHKIQHPPSLLDKLGVKANLTFRVAGKFDPAFLQELGSAGARRVSPRTTVDLVFLAADRATQLSQVAKLASALKPAGALWIVFPKGVTAIREIEVLEAGRAAGLKDVKVAGFSKRLTALKFVIPLTKR